MANSGLTFHSGDTHHLPELRIVLLGSVGAGKSSAGNTILGKDKSDWRSAQCVKRQGKVAGRQVTVVDTPGWWSDYPIELTTELVKQEIVLSGSLCPPGPHTLLLVIRTDTPFKETCRRSVEGHLQLLSDKAWSLTIVLFTFGDCLGDTTIEQHIEREGKNLQWLVEKCGNRFHVLNNMNWGDGTQVTELLEKIEEMVAGNGGCHYEMKRKSLQEVGERRRAEEERAKERMMKVQKQRESLRLLVVNTHQHLSELRIVLLGNRGAGKSSAGNTILGRKEFNTIGRTAQCVKRQGEVSGRQVTVIDTPGWWFYYPVKDTFDLHKQEIVLSASLCPPGPHTLLLVIRVTSAFTDTKRRAIEKHLQLLSERVWSHSIVLFTCGDWLRGRTIEQHIEMEGKALQWLVEKCGNRYHVLNNEDRGDGTQVTELLEKIEEIVAGNNGCHYEIDRKSLQDVEKWRRRAEENRYKERMTKVQKLRVKLESATDKASVVTEEEGMLRRLTKMKMWEQSEEPMKTNIKKAQSMEFIPHVSGKDKSDVESMTSSAYGSLAMLPGSDASSTHGSLLSATTSTSSGIGSLSSITESVRSSGSRRNTLTKFVSFRPDQITVSESEESLQHKHTDENRQTPAEQGEAPRQICYVACAHSSDSFKVEIDGRIVKWESKIIIQTQQYYPTWLDYRDYSKDLHRVDSSRLTIVNIITWSKQGTASAVRTMAVGECPSDTEDLRTTLVNISGQEVHSPSHGPERSCTSCTNVTDSTHWVLVEPDEVEDDGVSKYRVGSPPGSYECSVTGVRWVCACEVILQYRFINSQGFNAYVESMQYQCIGPAIDISIISGELEEAHLPHYACLGGADPSLRDAVRVLRETDSGVTLERCELTRFHAKLLHPSFSFLTVILNMLFPVNIHCELFLYRDKVVPRKFRVYLFPCDATLIEAVKNEEKSDGERIRKPKPERSLLKNNWYNLKTSCLSRITPAEIQLRDSTTTPNFFEVKDLRKSEIDFKMELISVMNNMPVWKADVEEDELSLTATVDHSGTTMPYGSRFVDEHRVVDHSGTTMPYGSRFVDEHRVVDHSGTTMPYGAQFIDKHRAALIKRVGAVMSIADLMLNKDLITDEQYSEIRAVSTSENKMREIYEVLRRAGPKEKAEFYKILHSEQRLLVEDLAKSGP